MLSGEIAPTNNHYYYYGGIMAIVICIERYGQLENSFLEKYVMLCG